MTVNPDTLTESNLPNMIYRGKVRDSHDIDDSTLLIVSTDRISAYDVIIPSAIPGKGAILNQMSLFWFNKTKSIINNHLIKSALDDDSLPESIRRRGMFVRKANRIDIECVARGYITGSALEEYNEITAGVVYEPINDQMFWAERGNGAWLNDRRMRVSGRTQMNESIIATGIPFLGKQYHNRFLKQMEAVMAVSAGIRRFGSAALDLAYVAAGRFDGFWETDLKPWDIAAGIIMIREAGGMISELDGRDQMLNTGSIIATNPSLYQDLMQIIKNAEK